MTKSIERKAIKGNLPDVLVKEVVELSAWNTTAKKALEMSSAQVAAKYLNKTGVSAEYQPEVTFVTSALAVASGYLMVGKRLEEFAKKQQLPAEIKNEAPQKTGP